MICTTKELSIIMPCYCGAVASDGSKTINNSIWNEEIFTTHDTFHNKKYFFALSDEAFTIPFFVIIITNYSCKYITRLIDS